MENMFNMQLTQKFAKEYQRANRKRKTQILNEYCKLTKVKRNTANKRIRKVVKDIHPQILKKKTRKRRGRKKMYTKLHEKIIQKAWDTGGNICAENLHPIIQDILIDLEKEKELQAFSKKTIEQCSKISLATLKRMISKFPRIYSKKDKNYSAILREVPIKANFGKHANKPGNIEGDYVLHNGGNNQGGFVVTGCYVDICLQWIARYSHLRQDYKSIKNIHENATRKIHHNIKEFHFDNCRTIFKYFLENLQSDNTKTDYMISRSRPYKKDDNAHVEQKNGDKIRKIVGHWRYDTKQEAETMNKLWEVEDLISNFFTPCVKLVRKELNQQNKVLRRIHDKPKTPFKRLMESKEIPMEIKFKLHKQKQDLSIVKLRKLSDKYKKELSCFEKSFKENNFELTRGRKRAFTEF